MEAKLAATISFQCSLEKLVKTNVLNTKLYDGIFIQHTVLSVIIKYSKQLSVHSRISNNSPIRFVNASYMYQPWAAAERRADHSLNGNRSLPIMLTIIGHNLLSNHQTILVRSQIRRSYLISLLSDHFSLMMPCC